MVPSAKYQWSDPVLAHAVLEMPSAPVTTCWTAAPPPSNSTEAPTKAALAAAVSGTTRRSRGPTVTGMDSPANGVAPVAGAAVSPGAAAPVVAAGDVPAVEPAEARKVTVPFSVRPSVLAITIWPSATLAGWPRAPPQNHVEEMAARGAAAGMGRTTGPPGFVWVSL